MWSVLDSSVLPSFIIYSWHWQVSRPNSIPPNTRDNLYQGLPPNVKASLRMQIHNLPIEEVIASLFSCMK